MLMYGGRVWERRVHMLITPASLPRSSVSAPCPSAAKIAFFLFTELCPNIGWRGRRLPHQFRPSAMAFYSLGGGALGAAVLASLILASFPERCDGRVLAAATAFSVVLTPI